MFKIEEFDIKLDTVILGRNFVYSEEVSSTNRFLLENEEFQKHGTVILAEYQTEGKGRFKREWTSMKNTNLTFSIILKSNLTPNNIGLINLASSLSVAQSIENLFQLKVELKWPNDVLINKKKVSGILLESVSEGSKIKRLVIGVGLNVNQATFQGQYTISPTSLKLETKKNVGRERVLSEILNTLEENFTLIGKDRDKLTQMWRSRCRMIGEKIKVYDRGEERFGIFEDIDSNGLLLLKTQEDIETISFGDVSLTSSI